MAGKQKEKRKKPPTKLGMGNGKARRYVEEQEEVMVTTTNKAGSGISKNRGGNRNLTVEEEYEDNYDDDDDEEDDNNNYNHNNNNDRNDYYNDEEEEDVYDDQDDSDEIIDDRDNNLVIQKSQPTRHSGKNYLGGSHARARQTTHSLQNITNYNRGGQEETPTCQGTRIDFPYTPAVSSMTSRSSHEHNYKLQLQAIGYHQTTASGKNQVKEYVGKSLFRRLKFIVGESEMETYGPIASIVMSHFKVKDENKVEWWMHNKQTVHKEIRQRRNNIGTALRNAFRSK